MKIFDAGGFRGGKGKTTYNFLKAHLSKEDLDKSLNDLCIYGSCASRQQEDGSHVYIPIHDIKQEIEIDIN